MKRSDQGMLSIGALSAATGVPVETIRSWERRYGFPVAERKPSGHRLYALSTVPRLQQVAKAIARGHRAAEVVAAPESALDSLLSALPSASERVAAAATLPTIPLDTPALIKLIRGFNADRLKQSFQADWAHLGPLGFVQHRAGPLLTAVGDAWASGALDIRHEHFASACLSDFLRSARMPLDDRATGPVVALATLPDELHGMGLQLAAVVFATAGWRILMLGTNTPVDQIVAVARETTLSAVSVSCVLARRRNGTEQLRDLRRKLPRRVSILVGGSAAPDEAPATGIEILTTLAALDAWLHERAE